MLMFTASHQLFEVTSESRKEVTFANDLRQEVETGEVRLR